MINLKFTKEQNQAIVDAILKGSDFYLEERRVKKNEMLVSAGYAWAKSNHIENALGSELKPLGIVYEEKRISSWEYLQFSIPENKVSFLVKSPSFIKSFQEDTKKNKQHYIRDYARCNDALIKSDDFQAYVVDKQLELPIEETLTLFEVKNEDIDRGYLVVYDTDVSGMIKEIKTFLPNSNGQMYEVDDLTPFIEKSTYEFRSDTLDIAEDTFTDAQSMSTDAGFDFKVTGKVKSDDTDIKKKSV